jgi:hypothetical protein
MSDDDFDAERFVDHAAALNGIRLAPEQRPGVIANFESFRALHRRFAGYDAPASPDPLAVFRP